MIGHTAELLITVAIAVLGSNGLWMYLSARGTAKTAQDKMLLGLGHAKIYQTAEKYLARGAVTTEELEDLVKYLYTPYKALGGNGSGDAIVNKVKVLPIISATTAERLDKEGRHYEKN